MSLIRVLPLPEMTFLLLPSCIVSMQLKFPHSLLTSSSLSVRPKGFLKAQSTYSFFQMVSVHLLSVRYYPGPGDREVNRHRSCFQGAQPGLLERGIGKQSLYKGVITTIKVRLIFNQKTASKSNLSLLWVYMMSSAQIGPKTQEAGEPASQNA